MASRSVCSTPDRVVRVRVLAGDIVLCSWERHYSDGASFHPGVYRKRPCISRTFFHKIEGKNQGCGLSMDTSVFGVLKNLINIHTTS